MTGTPNRAHLIERAVEALGGPDGMVVRAGGMTAGTDTLPRPPEPPRSPDAAPRPAIALEALLHAGLVPAGDRRVRQREEMSVVQNKVVLTLRAMAATPGRNPRLIMVTSARPAEGKSFLALNLAATLAHATPQPVLLVDADGKPGSLSEKLGCGEAPGLRTLAAEGSRAASGLVFPTEEERLSFLPCGRERAPGQAIAAATLKLAEALPRHLIVLDTPPALATSEAATLAPTVGQILVVVQAGRTRRPELEAALDMLDACPTLQLVLNQASSGASDAFGAYGYEARG